jgi:16S rRNA (cytidine1402-2'-O)-methyltransferase
MIEDCAATLGRARRAAIARELTKLHEQILRSDLGELAARVAQEPSLARGELVVVIEGAAAAEPTDAAAAELDRVLRVLLAELPLAQAARLAARLAGARDNAAYRRALALRAAATASDDPAT